MLAFIVHSETSSHNNARRMHANEEGALQIGSSEIQTRLFYIFGSEGRNNKRERERREYSNKQQSFFFIPSFLLSFSLFSLFGWFYEGPLTEKEIDID